MQLLPDGTRNVVEYGAGNGVLTHALLNSLGADAKLHAVEIVDQYAHELRQIADPRLAVLHENVRDVAARLRTLAPDGVDAIISGIPFSFLPPEARDEIVALTRDGLRPGGRFIVYQNSPAMLGPLQRCFTQVRLRFEPRNIRPYFIMVATR
jgi:phospholipid N-methyltransferase